MSDHHPRLQNLRSASHLLREASNSFSSNPITFLFLSLLILDFRTLVENGSYQLTSLIDHDPSVRALLPRIDLARASNSCRHTDFLLHRKRRPFLPLTCVGTLDDDFFFGDEEEEEEKKKKKKEEEEEEEKEEKKKSNRGWGLAPVLMGFGVVAGGVGEGGGGA